MVLYIFRISQNWPREEPARSSIPSEDARGVLTRPAFVEIGGSYRSERHTGTKDPEANVLFLVMVECDLCGHAQLFNPECLIGRSERILVIGLTPEEEAEKEAKGKLG